MTLAIKVKNSKRSHSGQIYLAAMQVAVDPSCVKGHGAIISHHVLTALFISIPWYHPKYASLMALNMIVEVGMKMGAIMFYTVCQLRSTTALNKSDNTYRYTRS